MVDRAKAIQYSRRTLALQRPDKAAENNGRRIPDQHVDVIPLAAPFDNFAPVCGGDLHHAPLETVSPFRVECAPSELRAEYDMHGQVVHTVACTVKVKIPDSLTPHLDALLVAAVPCIQRMLRDRTKASSKYYPEIPCVVSKSLLAKYQRNLGCSQVRRPVLPVCGDQGRQIKLTLTGIRVPALFGKTEVPVHWLRPVAGQVRQVEFFRRAGNWYGAISYNTRDL